METIKQPLMMTELQNRKELRRSEQVERKSRYMPHQGKREIERRRKRLLTLDSTPNSE